MVGGREQETKKQLLVGLSLGLTRTPKRAHLKRFKTVFPVIINKSLALRQSLIKYSHPRAFSPQESLFSRPNPTSLHSSDFPLLRSSPIATMFRPSALNLLRQSTRSYSAQASTPQHQAQAALGGIAEKGAQAWKVVSEKAGNALGGESSLLGLQWGLEMWDGVLDETRKTGGRRGKGSWKIGNARKRRRRSVYSCSY